MKQIAPNYEIMLSSAVTSLQQAYKAYKDAVIDNLNWTFIDDDGKLVMLEGVEERIAKINELKKEVVRLKFKVGEIRNEVGA